MEQNVTPEQPAKKEESRAFLFIVVPLVMMYGFLGFFAIPLFIILGLVLLFNGLWPLTILCFILAYVAKFMKVTS